MIDGRRSVFMLLGGAKGEQCRCVEAVFGDGNYNGNRSTANSALAQDPYPEHHQLFTITVS